MERIRCRIWAGTAVERFVSVWIRKASETAEHTIAPSCIAWFPVVIVSFFSRIFNFLCIVLFQVPGGGEISAVCGRGG